MRARKEPIVLVDEWQDGFAEQWGCVELQPGWRRVSEEEARQTLAEFVGDDPPNLPTGPAEKAWYRPSTTDFALGEWVKCERHDQGAVCFWRIDCTTFAAPVPSKESER